MKIHNVIIDHPELGLSRVNISIQDGRIEEVSLLDAPTGDFSSVEFYVTPGFVNSHIHPNQLYDRRLLDECGISELLHQMHGNYKKTDEDRYVQALFVTMEALKSGATSLYAVASNPYPVIQAFKTFGMKGAVTCFYNDKWEGYGNAPSLIQPQDIETQFAQASKEKTDRIDIHIGSASVESASNQLLLLLDELAKKYQTKVNIHVSEGIDSVKTCLASRKTTPVRLLDNLGVLSSSWNLIHAATLEADEISLLGKSKASVIHCPVSNAKTGVGVAPIKELMEAGVNIGIGSDACSNNNTNNILSEAYFAHLIHGAFYKDPKLVTLKVLKQWLTKNGYHILGINQKGTIEKGEPADLLLWALNENAFVPLPFKNFDSALIFSAPDIKPHTVIMNGKIVVENYRCTLVSEKEVSCGVNRVAMKLGKDSCCSIR
ncbi:MAG: amidohydrolase family protein [Chlamydiae bacterium]|nr:amidohydrolase family protein [Chlamydiota bacterium]